jgi:hypothetical protein
MGRERVEYKQVHFVFEVDFMVKLLRACVWMPWRNQAMKDAVSCDKPRGDANSLRSGGLRMGKPNWCEHQLRSSEYIG